jgi:micrococcal nuclease
MSNKSKKNKKNFRNIRPRYYKVIQSKNIWELLPLILSISFIIIYACYFWIKNQEGNLKFPIGFKRIYDYNNIKVIRVIDGDTIKIEDGSLVRLIGIDTPEYYESNKLFRDARRLKQDIATIKKMGAMSYAFTKQMLQDKYVRLEFDIEKYDKYGRLLAYVFLPDGTFVNGKIIEKGYACVYTIPPNVKYAALLNRLQQEAREKNAGLWGIDPLKNKN